MRLLLIYVWNDFYGHFTNLTRFYGACRSSTWKQSLHQCTFHFFLHPYPNHVRKWNCHFFFFPSTIQRTNIELLRWHLIFFTIGRLTFLLRTTDQTLINLRKQSDWRPHTKGITIFVNYSIAESKTDRKLLLQYVLYLCTKHNSIFLPDTSHV